MKPSFTLAAGGLSDLGTKPADTIPHQSRRLSDLVPGQAGQVAPEAAHVMAPELQTVMDRFGLFPGAQVQCLGEAPFGHDPMIIKIDNHRLAIRRAMAQQIAITAEA